MLLYEARQFKTVAEQDETHVAFYLSISLLLSFWASYASKLPEAYNRHSAFHSQMIILRTCKVEEKALLFFKSSIRKNKPSIESWR